MKILLVAATYPEIQPVMERLSLKPGSNIHHQHEVFVLVTGVGMVATAYSLGKILAVNVFDLAINAGIAGSFNRAIGPGEVVCVNEDHLPELGAEDDEVFLPIDQLGFGTSKVVPSHPAYVVCKFKQVRAVTVNKVHGNDQSILRTVKGWSPDIESMEGAAFFYACNDVNLPCVQIRGISNFVEKRNREAWNIGLAVNNLNEALINVLSEL